MKNKNLIEKTASVFLTTGIALGSAALLNTTVVKAETQTEKDTNVKSNNPVQNLQTKADQTAHDLTETEKADQTAKNNVADAQEKLTRVKADQTNKTQELETAQKEQADKQTQADKDKAAVDLQAEKAEKLQAEADALKKEGNNDLEPSMSKEEAQQTIADVTTELTQANEELKIATNQKQANEKNIKIEQKTLASKERAKEGKSKEAGNHKRCIIYLNKYLQNIIQTPEKDVANVPKDIQIIFNKLTNPEEVKAEIKKEEGLQNKARGEVAELEDHICQLNDRIVFLQQKKAGFEQKISDLNERIQVLKGSKSKAEQVLAEKPDATGSTAEVQKAQAAATAAKTEVDRLADIYRASLTTLEQAKQNVEEKQKAKDEADAAVAKAQQILTEAIVRQQNTAQALIAAQQANEAAKLALQKVQKDATTTPEQTKVESAKEKDNPTRTPTDPTLVQDVQDHFNQIVTETLNNLTPPATENVSSIVGITPTEPDTTVTVNENPKSEAEPVINKTKVQRYYVLTKTDSSLQKLKPGRSVKYHHAAFLRGKKDLHLVKITKHHHVYKIWRKMKAGKKYQTLALKRIGQRYYAQIKLSVHKTAWIKLKYVKFLKK